MLRHQRQKSRYQTPHRLGRICAMGVCLRTLRKGFGLNTISSVVTRVGMGQVRKERVTYLRLRRHLQLVALRMKPRKM